MIGVYHLGDELTDSMGDYLMIDYTTFEPQKKIEIILCVQMTF